MVDVEQLVNLLTFFLPQMAEVETGVKLTLTVVKVEDNDFSITFEHYCTFFKDYKKGN